jgi:hypothetical protein
MAFKQNQHQMFAFEVLPLLFHNETTQFMTYLRKDGVEFLKFWWDRAGISLDPELRSSPEGFDFEIHPFHDGREIVIVRMPPPKKTGESYYLGLVTKPLKRSILSWRNLGRVFTLNRTAGENADENTELGELTKMARYVAIGKGPKATKKAFFDSICGQLNKK